MTQYLSLDISVSMLESLEDSELSELIDPVVFFFFDLEDSLDSLFCFFAVGGLEPSLFLISGLYAACYMV